MAQLLSLSNEILLEILSYSYDSHSHRRAPSLARIVFTCRRLHALAINILLERVDLDCTTKQYSKFLRAIKTNPTLGPKVRFLDLQWNDFLCRKSDPQELLRRLPHLQCLSMKVMQSYKLDSLSYALSPSQRLGRCFYKMNIHLEKPSSRDLPDLLLINQVHVLEATIPRINNICPVPVAERFQARTAPLQSFTTLGATKISTYNLHNLLTYPKALTHLAIALPGTEDRSSAGRTTIAQMDGPVAPSAIARSLLPATISLQSLEIHGHMQYFDGHDGTRLSLCQFTALETATLSSRLFFSDDASADPTGFYALLPPSIREITVCRISIDSIHCFIFHLNLSPHPVHSS